MPDIRKFLRSRSRRSARSPSHSSRRTPAPSFSSRPPKKLGLAVHGAGPAAGHAAQAGAAADHQGQRRGEGLPHHRKHGVPVRGAARAGARIHRQDLDFNGLNDAASRIQRYYRERGYFLAVAYLPQQEIKDGIVEIAVLEGAWARSTCRWTRKSG